MPPKNTKILEFNQYHKSDKAPFIIYAEPECLLEKIDGCKKNHENSSATKVGEHTGSSLDLPCVQQLDVAPFCENYAKFYFDTKMIGKNSMKSHFLKIKIFKVT